MALIAYLQLSSKIYKVCDFTYHTSRPHNGLRPDGNARCEHIQITVNVPAKSDTTLYGWFIKGESQEFNIFIEKSDEQKKNAYHYKKMGFTGALCYAMMENFDANVNKLRELKLSIVAGSVEIKDINLTSKYTESSTSGSAASSMLVTEDLSLSDSDVGTKTIGAYLLEDFQYEVLRARNTDGIPFGTIPAATLNFTLKMDGQTSSSLNTSFYDTMKSNQPLSFTFLFHSSFGEATKMSDYNYGIIAHGYVVDIEESFVKAINENSAASFKMNVRLLLAKLSFVKSATLDESTNKHTYDSTTLTITND